MKSKAFILRQISELLEKNRGLCDVEIQEWIKENENMTVYELLTFKKELSKTKEFQDVSFMRWFRDESS
jgi:TFIIF-interacting CTD phosphatase-like protein|tara:strand:+ start:3061 stop:3267 length:207 start_codon:yes stop_codon:yes gene_type:complete